MNQRELFFRHVAQTSTAPLALEIVKAEGSLLWDAEGKEYIDMIAGISVCNVGHRHPRVVKAIRRQADQYLHLLVYGEFVESPQVLYAQEITKHLPGTLNSVYFTNSGAEAVEGAMKLAKRVTNRTQIIAFKESYHGSTQGALSIIGDEYWRQAYRPLLPDVLHLEHGSFEAIAAITDRTACVIAEPIQAERGVYTPSKEWMKALRAKCSETGTLLILDEIQTGFGRTGTLWAFEQFNITPDVLLLGKALGGGMPLGAFIADKAIMMHLAKNPVLGHITTFGGHPVCCAAGHAALKVLLKESLIQEVKKKEAMVLDHLKHPLIKSIRSNGLMMAIEFDSFDTNKKIIDACIRKGVLTDWFLFAASSMRLVPPLTISPKELKKACKVILEAMHEVAGE